MSGKSLPLTELTKGDLREVNWSFTVDTKDRTRNTHRTCTHSLVMMFGDTKDHSH